MPIRTTAGQVEVNQALPPELRNYSRVLDKKGTESVLREVAERYPEQYVDVSKALSDIGRFHAQRTGGYSFGLHHMAKSQIAIQLQEKLKSNIDRVLRTVKEPEERRKRITDLIAATQKEQIDKVFDEGIKNKNPLAMQIHSGARGSKSNYNSLVGGDLGYNDTHDNMIPTPVMRTYSQGLSFPEYWASLSGARKGVVDVKEGVRNAGYYNKLLNQVSHRNVVVDNDEPDDEYGMDDRKKYIRGLPVSVQDKGSVGALLARDTGSFRENTIITPKILDALERKGEKKIIVRSPIARSSPDGGVYAYDVGLNENGRLVQKGEMPGMVDAQGVGEPVTQTGLNSKHTGGVAGSTLVSGFKAYEQMIQIPDAFQGAATHAVKDGTVKLIQKAPAGGTYVWIGDDRHYVPPGQSVTSKVGESVEAGDTLSNGVPNPEKITDHKGIGEGRRYWVNTMMDLAKGQNMKIDRRNLELISRGLINHVRLNDFVGDYLPDDVVPYHLIEAAYHPREGSQRLQPKKAVGKYLESPILHHTVGVRMTPKMAKEMNELGLDEVEVHDKPPPFKFEMIRASDNLLHDPDPLTRMYGSNLSKGLLNSVHRGGVSDREGTSFVPSLAAAANFGREGYFQNKTKPLPLPPEGSPLPKTADYDPMGLDNDTSLHAVKPVEPPKMPWEKQPGNSSPNPYLQSAPKNNMPDPGFSSHNPHQPLAGTAAQASPKPPPMNEQPLPPMMQQGWQANTQPPSFQQQYGVASPWQQQPQDQPPAWQQTWRPQQSAPQPGGTHDGFDYSTGGMVQSGDAPAGAAVATKATAASPGILQHPIVNAAGSLGTSYGAQVAAPRLAQQATGKALSGVGGKALGGIAGLAAGTGWDMLAGNEVTPGGIAENAASAGLGMLGPYGVVGGSAAIDLAKNLTGMTTKEDIDQRKAQLEGTTWQSKQLAQKAALQEQLKGQMPDEQRAQIQSQIDQIQKGVQEGTNNPNPKGEFSMGAGLMAVTSPVTTGRALVSAGEDRDKMISDAQKTTQHASGYYDSQAQKALGAPGSEETFAKVYTSNRGKADMELADFRTDLVKNARPGDHSYVEKMVGEKMQQRADVRSQLQMADSGQIPLKQEQYAKLQNHLNDLNRVIRQTHNELTNPSSFSAGTLSKALLQNTDEKPSQSVQEFNNDLASAPEQMGMSQFHAASRLRDMHSQYADIKKKLADPALSYGDQQKLVAQRDELDTKMREERRSLKG